MCGRYSLAIPDPGAVRARFPIGESIEIRQRYNVAPGDDVLAVTTTREGEARGELLRWGLVPSWAERPESPQKMINARAETVSERPAYRRAFERYRCLIIADGFYEWQRREEAPKQPFRITRAGGELFAFAGLWSIWHAPDGSKLRSCAIITTAANEALAPIHDRMPVILEPDQEQAWLQVATAGEELRSLLQGLPAEKMSLQAVSTAVNDARYDGPECLQPPVERTQRALF